MNRQIIALSLVVLALIGGAAGVLAYTKKNQRLGAPGVKVAAVPSLDQTGRPVTTQSIPLPESLLGGQSKLLPIMKEELAMLPPDTTYGRRAYWWTNQPAVLAHAVLMGADRTSIHKPEYCLPGQGFYFSEADMEIIQVPMTEPFPYELPVMAITATRHVLVNGTPVTERALYLFWFVCDREITPRHTTRMWSQTKHLLRTGELQRWAYISYFATCPPGQEAPTLDWLKQVIAASVPQFQLPPRTPAEAAALTGGK